jgi:glycosyltransferase involved in cell wall biosynthesis
LAYTFYENDNRVRRYAEALSPGNDVEVLALRRKGQATTDYLGGVKVSRIQRRAVTESRPVAYLLKLLAFFLRSMFTISVRHVRHPYDIVHVHNVPDFLVFAALVPRLMGARLILDIHDILPELYADKFDVSRTSLAFRALLLVERLSCRFADHVVVANALWHKRLITRAVVEGKCTTILNYPDLRIFRPLPAGQKRRDGRFLMLYPGTLNHHQGLDIAIKAFALVKDRMPGAELHIYGEGPARPELVKLAVGSSVRDSVRIMDRLPLEEIAQIMASADVGVVPKRADGFGNEAFSTKTLEFMACGVPVVVSKTMVDAHYFDSTVVRFFVPGSEADLAAALLDVYDNRLQHDPWINSARQFALRNSWQERVGDYTKLIQSLVGSATRYEASVG